MAEYPVRGSSKLTEETCKVQAGLVRVHTLITRVSLPACPACPPRHPGPAGLQTRTFPEVVVRLQSGRDILQIRAR